MNKICSVKDNPHKNMTDAKKYDKSTQISVTIASTVS